MIRSNTISVNTVDLFQLPGRLVDAVLLWHERARERHDLASLDARALEDIGLTAEQAAIEARKPFWRA